MLGVKFMSNVWEINIQKKKKKKIGLLERNCKEKIFKYVFLVFNISFKISKMINLKNISFVV